MSNDLLMVLRLLLAGVLGAAVGYERERAAKPAGFRTHLLVCLGAAMFTLVSIYGFKLGTDPSRVAAGVVSGVGFLGAGTIIHREGGLLEGLTTAASIWAVASIGVAAAVGLYALSVVGTVLVLVTLMLPSHRFRR